MRVVAPQPAVVPCLSVQPDPLLQNATRGETLLMVNDTSRMKPGQWVRLVQDSPAKGGLVDDLYEGAFE